MKTKVHFYSHLQQTTMKVYRVSMCGLWEDSSVIQEYRITKDACLVTCKKCIKKIAPQHGDYQPHTPEGFKKACEMLREGQPSANAAINNAKE